MTIRTHVLSVPGATAARGFWLYACRAESPRGELVYVGRTGTGGGKPSQRRAQSVFYRLARHINKDEPNNTSSFFDLSVCKDFHPRDCGEIRMVAVGPIFEDTTDQDEYRKRLDRVSAMEWQLCKDMTRAGYQVINVPTEKGILDPQLWREVRAEFAVHFPRLNAGVA